MKKINVGADQRAGRLAVTAKEVSMPIRKAEAKSAVDPASSGDVIEELRRRYDRLTQSQKRIAEYIVEHSQAVAFSTVDQMAAQLDVNPSTIVRFTYRLGLNGLPGFAGADARTGARPALTHRRPHQRRSGGRSSGRHEFRRLAQSRLAKSASHHIRSRRRRVRPRGQYSLRSRRVYVAAGFSTFPVAHYFALVLDRLRSEISLLASNDAFATPRLVEIKPEDCVLAFTFPRYASATHRIALWAKENKAKVIAVTDSPISAVGQLGDVVLLAASAGTGMQNSMVAPMAVANALLNGVAAVKGTPALERYSRHDRLMNRWDAFLLKLDGAD